LAITSALSSGVVQAIELLEFPNEIPMATRSPGFVPFAVGSSADMLIGYEILEGCPTAERFVKAQCSADFEDFFSWNFEKFH
jgi:hypothetical protein